MLNVFIYFCCLIHNNLCHIDPFISLTSAYLLTHSVYNFFAQTKYTKVNRANLVKYIITLGVYNYVVYNSYVLTPQRGLH